MTEFLDKIVTRIVNLVLAIFLAIMAIIVFINVVLRYGFHSAIPWADEASRYLFIWVIFLGAFIAYKENAHLGVDLLLQRLSVKGKKILFICNNFIVLAILLLIVVGSWEYLWVTADARSAALDIPLCFVYGSGFIACLGMAVISVNNIYKLVTGKLSVEELITISGSEEDQKVEQLTSVNTAGGAKQQ